MSSPIYDNCFLIFFSSDLGYSRLEGMTWKELFHKYKRNDHLQFICTCWYLCCVNIQDSRKAERTLVGDVQIQDVPETEQSPVTNTIICHTVIFTSHTKEFKCPRLKSLEMHSYGAGRQSVPRHGARSTSCDALAGRHDACQRSALRRPLGQDDHRHYSDDRLVKSLYAIML